MAKPAIDIRSLARSHTTAAIKALARIVRSTEAPESAVISAANALLDRGYGKAPQVIVGDAENPITIIQRVIIDERQEAVELQAVPLRAVEKAE